MIKAGFAVGLRWCGSARLRAASVVAAFAVATFAASIDSVRADEGGVSFWIPGFYGSLAAAPQVPGWSVASIYYHTTVSAGADVAFARQVPVGHITVPFSGNFTGNLNASADIGMTIPQYVFATPVLGGQAAVGMIVPIGNARTSVDAALTGAAGPIGFTIAGGRTDDVTGFADLVPQASLRWHDGVHNWMTYITGDVPVGRYDAMSLANLGIGHGAIDAGGGYTYLDQATGHEFSAVLGFTYNFINPDTQYQSGVDMHFDWAASQFLSKQFLVGLVGYAYDQLSCDSGAGDRVGCFESRVLGVGPQLGYIFQLDEHYQGYLNLKAYKEFDSNARPEGWNVWLTFAISPAAPTSATPSHLITK